MKKILIIIPYLGVGGTMSSLIAFLECINSDEIMVDVFARKRQGCLKDSLVNCNLLEENLFLSSKMLHGTCLEKFICSFFNGFNYVLGKFGLSLYPFLCKVGGKMLHTSNYDAVIGYQENLCSFLAYLPAKKRIGWVRSEYERYIKIINNRNETRFYKRIDVVVAVSEFARKSFLKIHPWHENVVTINNFMNVDAIRWKSKDKSKIVKEFQKGEFTIISVGRLAPVKQFEEIPFILYKIKEKVSIDIKWYIVGGSRGYKQLEQKMNTEISKYGLESSLILLPETDNPYAYISEGDVLVHTSKSETYSRVVAEAKVLGVPVVVNTYGAAYEFVKNNQDGFIVPNCEMAEILLKLINDREIVNGIKKQLASYNWSNDLLMQKTISIL